MSGFFGIVRLDGQEIAPGMLEKVSGIFALSRGGWGTNLETGWRWDLFCVLRDGSDEAGDATSGKAGRATGSLEMCESMPVAN